MFSDTDTIEIPVTVWRNAESLEDLEDWLLANNPEALARLRDLRSQHLAGQVIPLDDAEKQWPTK